MGIRPRKSSSRGPGALLGRLALSGRDRLYRPRVACRGACPHAQAEWCRGACPDAQPRALHPEIAAEDRPPLHLRSRHSIGPIALPRRVATALRRRAARRATPTERPTAKAATTCPLVKGNSNNFTLIWPRLRRVAKLCSHRVHAHIFPFQRVAFVAAQQMIEKAFLP